MNFIEPVRIAFDSLQSNKLRAILTMLGIIIGVAAVILMVGIGRGAQASVENQIRSIGTNVMFITPGSSNQGGVRTAAGSAQTLTYADATALASVPGVAAVAPEYDNRAQVVYQGNNVNTRVAGVTPEYTSVRNMNVANGAFIDAAQVQGSSAVVVLGANVAQNLFPAVDPVGQSVRINNQTFRVIGVMEAKGGSGFGSQDDQVFIPITTATLRLFQPTQYRGSKVVSTINLQAASEDQVKTVQQAVTDTLRERHNLTTADNDFSILSQEDILQTASTVTGVFTILLGSIAGISLLVGGIGIMNIMLVSVTERTKEIGLRKAIGARKRDIMAQFLTEAAVLSVVGGLIGVTIAFIAGSALGGINLGTFKLSPSIGLDSVLLATMFSLGVGIFFGAYPANRAANLRPIEALRYE
ncbi:MAG: ABC transporter permease [Anaerolineae bacterium]